MIDRTATLLAQGTHEAAARGAGAGGRAPGGVSPSPRGALPPGWRASRVNLDTLIVEGLIVGLVGVASLPAWRALAEWIARAVTS